MDRIVSLPSTEIQDLDTEGTVSQVTVTTVIVATVMVATVAMEATVHTAEQRITATSRTFKETMDTLLAMVELVTVTLAPLATKVMVHTMPTLLGATLKMLPELAGGVHISSTHHLRSLTRLINRSTAQSSPNVKLLLV